MSFAIYILYNEFVIYCAMNNLLEKKTFNVFICIHIYTHTHHMLTRDNISDLHNKKNLN